MGTRPIFAGFKKAKNVVVLGSHRLVLSVVPLSPWVRSIRISIPPIGPHTYDFFAILQICYIQRPLIRG